ncbi:response regulator transcription factor [Nocardioides agariphilus]|jgi:DNA-binding NarL/FixJ family response regulator|nr:response regulator transcription factor [Nocardioides agariphilus]
MAPVAAQPLQLALLHPQRTWVDSLERMLASWPGIEVVTAHTTFKWAWAAVARGAVQVVLMGLGEGYEPEHIADLRAAGHAVSVVVVSENDDEEQVTAAIRAGARGWVRPDVDPQQLVTVLHAVHDGETWIPPDLVTVVIDSLLAEDDRRSSSRQAMGTLSAREVEILDCLAQGMTRGEIGDRYLLSPHTVRTHINHVLRKLDVHSTLAAVSLANHARLPG